VGKSSIMRALQWVGLNQTMTETEVVRGHGKLDGVSAAHAELVIDGHRIRRSRGKGDNLYFLDDSEFRSFATSVPDPIAAMLRMSDINFQNQIGMPFWLCLSGGEASRELNALVDLGVIDESLSAINRIAKQATCVVEACRTRVQQCVSRCDELRWVAEADAELSKVEQVAVQVAQITAAAAALSALLVTARACQTTCQTARQQQDELTVVGKAGSAAIKLGQSADELDSLCTSLRRQSAVVDVGYPDTQAMETAVDDIRDLTRRYSDLERVILQVRQVSEKVSAGYPDISELEAAAQSYNRLEQLAGSLSTLIADIRDATGLVRSLRDQSLRLDADIEQVTSGVCPVCGGPYHADQEESHSG